MSTIQAQIELEKRMVAFGVSRYKSTVDKAQDKGRGADVQTAQKLMQEFIDPVATALKDWAGKKHTGIGSKYRTLLKVVDPDVAAYLALRAVFDHFTHDSPLVSLAARIGMLVEDEAKFTKFQEQHGEYYDAIIDDFKKKGTVNYRHMHRVLTMKAKTHDVAWNDWSNEERIGVGVKLLDFILQTTDLIEKKQERAKGRKIAMQTIIVPSESCLSWVKEFDAYAQMLNPDRAPCIIEPDPWTSVDQGGYYTPQLRRRTPLVKVRNRKHLDLFQGKLDNVCKAVNILQHTPWAVNHGVFDILKAVWDKSLSIGLPQSEPYTIAQSPVPKGINKASMSIEQRAAFEEWKSEARVVHTMNKERVSKCFQVIRVLRLAKEFMEHDRFWFVYQCDFRGRIYSTVSGLSPQGPDFAKALLQFAEGQPLTERGLYWLRVHGANTYGKDKLAYDDRVQWVIDNTEQILRISEDPISNREFWADSDKPWQFLAFCIEYGRLYKESFKGISYLPVALDGSCNGLQNFSAMLRDRVGASATNLVPSRTPTDIYYEVAQVCTGKLRSLSDPLALDWIRFCDQEHQGFLPRGLTKRPVMTLPYGSTQQSCREYIYKYMLEDAPNSFPKEMRFKLACYLTPILWNSIGEVVIAARKAMDWVQKCAGILAKENKPITWTTPLGFIVLQDRKKVFSRQIRTQLAGKLQLRVNVDSDKIDVQKQRLGASPNFVHSMDACHLMMTLLNADTKGIHSFACIHDDFGTHANNTDLMHQAIREAFVDMYTANDPLTALKTTLESDGVVLPDVPSRGTLDINDVLRSLYFFG